MLVELKYQGPEPLLVGGAALGRGWRATPPSRGLRPASSPQVQARARAPGPPSTAADDAAVAGATAGQVQQRDFRII